MHFDWSQGGWLFLFVVLGASLAAAVIAIAAISISLRRNFSGNGSLFADMQRGTAFLFDHEDLVDATSAGRALLTNASAGDTHWARLSAFLAPRFPDFGDEIQNLAERGRISLVSRGATPLSLRAEWIGGLTRITLGGIEPETGGMDPISQRAMEEELAELRSAMDCAPLLVWRETGDGAVVWANRGYLSLAGDDDAEIPWPLPRLFPGLDTDPAKDKAHRRASIVAPGQEGTRWYDCHVRPGPQDQRLIFALPADAAVQAEASLRSFIQTLTKTFAHLEIGLAIFDRKRQLVLFNPALIDLAQLSPEFLSSRPTLTAMLDAMHEKRMIPEPKDYKSWRARIAALEKAATSGQYEETWSLPSGQTYRVTGRPHPDGAIAFLVEDISAEMNLTRRFRAELELSQAVIDGLEDAIAVFSPAGQMVVSNAAYAALWGTECGSAPVALGIIEATAWWQARCAPSPIWPKVRDFVATVGTREGWTAEVRLSDGRGLTCRFTPVAGGATMARFVPVSPVEALAEPPAPRKRRQRRA